MHDVSKPRRIDCLRLFNRWKLKSTEKRRRCWPFGHSHIMFLWIFCSFVALIFDETHIFKVSRRALHWWMSIFDLCRLFAAWNALHWLQSSLVLVGFFMTIFLKLKSIFSVVSLALYVLFAIWRYFQTILFTQSGISKCDADLRSDFSCSERKWTESIQYV